MSQLKMTQTYIYKWKNLPRPIARRQKQVAKQCMSTQSRFAKNILIYRKQYLEECSPNSLRVALSREENRGNFRFC